ncbi:MAG: glutamate-5-semialdehyde dehydrogenase [Actinobacteria bacterium]|uniref:glutamate-5-semialdehyde dehydrogenase n=1 Tax=freshwater metagenome TaxID=449393 RepID=A0A6J6G5I4_9ZZZZ|nr:glutamate-5-semialdehyde dehydrogenase [Actinomycetota bacterium]
MTTLTGQIETLATAARSAARILAATKREAKDRALNAIAEHLIAHESEILAANNEDVLRSQADGISDSLIDRLKLNPQRIAEIANGARQIAALPDPVGRIIRERTLENGLHLKQIAVPFGVVGMVYEARPNVTVDAAVILIKAGSAALLRGSSTAAKSNEVLVNVMRSAITSVGLPADIVQLVSSHDRSTVRELLNARGLVDLVIPRGSAALIRTVVDKSSVPTIETGAGVCHVYIDKDADFNKAIPIVINSKCHRPSVCNAAETLLVHEAVATEFLPLALKALAEQGVRLHGDPKSIEIAKSCGIEMVLASEEDWSTEYGVLEMNVGIVTDRQSANDHINKYGTQHTESIVTESESTAAAFIANADAAAIMVNASTRFTDGEQMGFGAEIGISNQKLHARGPMGLEEMTTTTWIVTGSGQIRE